MLFQQLFTDMVSNENIEEKKEVLERGFEFFLKI